jgi:hypothetical protein
MALYIGGITISTNFEIPTGKPIDARFWADTYTDLATFPSVAKWKGMICFVIDEDTWYYLKSDLTTWKKLGSSSAGADIYLQRNFI